MSNVKSIDDVDPIETQEWLESLQAVNYHAGADRAKYILHKLNKTWQHHRKKSTFF